MSKKNNKETPAVVETVKTVEVVEPAKKRGRKSEDAVTVTAKGTEDEYKLTFSVEPESWDRATLLKVARNGFMGSIRRILQNYVDSFGPAIADWNAEESTIEEMFSEVNDELPLDEVRELPSFQKMRSKRLKLFIDKVGFDPTAGLTMDHFITEAQINGEESGE